MSGDTPGLRRQTRRAGLRTAAARPETGFAAVAAVDAELRDLGGLPEDGDVFRLITGVARRPRS